MSGDPIIGREVMAMIVVPLDVCRIKDVSPL